MLFTRRGLLRWQTAREVERRAQKHLAGLYQEMWIAPILGAAVTAYLSIACPSELPVSLLLLGAWMLAPAVAWWISKPLKPAAPDLTESEKMFLRKLARRTWRFFEVFVGPEDHW